MKPHGKTGHKRKEPLTGELRELKERTSALKKPGDGRNLPERLSKESGELFRQVVEHSHHGILIIDDAFKIIYANEELCHMSGYSLDRIIGKDFRKFLGNESAQLLADRYLRRQRGEDVPSRYESTIVTRSGKKRRVRISSSVFGDSSGKKKTVAQIMDISESTRAEEALRESEKRFKELWDNAPVAYHTVNTKGTITSVNRTEAKMLGYSPKEMMGKSIFDFILPEQRQEARERFKLKLAGRHLPRAENRMYVKKDGSRLHVIIDDMLEYDSNGKVTGIRTTMVDTTDRMKVEEALEEIKERYKSLFDRSLYCVYLHDFEGRFLDANKAALKLLGYTKKQISNLSFVSLLDQPQLPRAFKLLDEIRMTGHQKEPSLFKLKTKNGDCVWAETEATVIYREGKPYAIQGIARDITESIEGEAKLRESQERYRTLAENAMDGIYIISPEGFEYVNQAFEKIFSYKSKEVCNKNFNFLELVHPDDRNLVLKRENGRKKGEKLPSEYSFRIMTKDGKTKYVEVNTVPLPGEKVRVLGILRDITRRKLMELALQESEAKYRTLVQTSPDAVTATDLKGNIIYASPQTLKLHGFKSQKELIGKSSFTLIAAEDHAKAMKNLKKTLREGAIRDVEYTLLRRDGTRFVGELNCALVKDAEETPRMFIATTRDITESKKAEEKIRETKARYQDLVEKAGVAILIDDRNAKIQYCNKKYAEMFGYTMEEMKKQTIHSIVHPDDVERVMGYHKGRIQGKNVPSRYECRGIRKDGSVIFIEIHAIALRKEGKISGTRSYIWDITERKKAESALQISEEKFRTLFNSAGDAIFIHDLNGRILEANQVACERLGYAREKLLRMNLADIDHPKSRAAVPKRIDELEYRGHIFFETAHCNKNGTVMPIELSSRIIEYQGRPAALSIARDITERKLAEEERKHSFERVRKALEETVNALASAVEMRDPYTAGHQHRVTTLACAIAGEMGLSEEQINAIRLAGIVHDVGKIRVPAEILSWPGRLTEIDFNMIKTHPQVGYDILKRIEFPYSVGKIMLQHHERMDGSGYPSGLKGNEILLEARILAVADVVEAMASHRPYRAALGIETALEEISKNKKTLYDPDVVDVCMKLFNEKKFKFD